MKNRSKAICVYTESIQQTIRRFRDPRGPPVEDSLRLRLIEEGAPLNAASSSCANFHDRDALTFQASVIIAFESRAKEARLHGLLEARGRVC